MCRYCGRGVEDVPCELYEEWAREGTGELLHTKKISYIKEAEDELTDEQ